MRFKRFKIVLTTLLLCVFFMNASWAQQPSCSAALTSISADSLLQHLQELVGKKPIYIKDSAQFIPSRFAFHPGNALAAEYISQKCESYGYAVRNMQYSQTGQNVIAEKRGTQFPNKSVMLCAHYDCVGSSHAKFQGADDNASGCAALLEAARVLKDINFPYTIQLAFWDEEEMGLVGSKNFPSSGGGLPEIITVINLDMIAWDGNQDSLAMIHVTPSLPQSIAYARRIQEVLKQHNLALQPFVKNPGEPNTDHQTFWNRDIPAIGLTEDYDNDFNPHWHRFSDSIENLHIPYFINMSKLAIMGLCELAQDALTQLPEPKTASFYAIYPNPAEHQICFNSSQKIVYVSIYNALGKLVFEQNLLATQDDCIAQSLPEGLYFVRLLGLNQSTIQEKIWIKP
jgi:hypothetical protein